MIRMIFHPELNMTKQGLVALSAKLAPLKCNHVIEPSGRALILIETNQNAGNLAYTLPKIKNYKYCSDCNSLHFRDEHKVIEVFRCMCGKWLK